MSQCLTIVVEFFLSHLLPPTPPSPHPSLLYPQVHQPPLSYALMFHSQRSVPLFLLYQLLVYSVQCQNPPASVRKLCDKSIDVHSVHRCWREVLMEADYCDLSTKHFHPVVMQGPHDLHVLQMSASPCRPAPSAVSLLQA